MKRIDHPLGPEELAPGSIFEVTHRGRTMRVTVPKGARYGTTLRVGELMVRLVRRATPPVCHHERVTDLVLSPAGAEEMVDTLVRSTKEGREFAGTCRVRPPAASEISGDEATRTWVIEGFETKVKGSASEVSSPPSDGSPLDWHTHPGLRGGFAGFSTQDERVVDARRRPMTVIGYTALSPQFLTALTIPLGGWGFAASLGLHALLQAEARVQGVDPKILRVGVAARVRFPGGRVLPMRLLDQPGWARVWSDATFHVDQAATKASQVANEAALKAWEQIRKKLPG
ncbi:MAG: hypothetical protein GY913_19360 [Proteobacteria bacterium]|nr:hypothetical protein [Pseudomonadota bacterium]MCP4919069.1 hypothetical protein [Pseudomonadota bacterium]